MWILFCRVQTIFCSLAVLIRKNIVSIFSTRNRTALLYPLTLQESLGSLVGKELKVKRAKMGSLGCSMFAGEGPHVLVVLKSYTKVGIGWYLKWLTEYDSVIVKFKRKQAFWSTYQAKLAANITFTASTKRITLFFKNMQRRKTFAEGLNNFWD